MIHTILIFFHRLRVELVILVIAFTGLALELVLGIITLWIFQRYFIQCGTSLKGHLWNTDTLVNQDTRLSPNFSPWNKGISLIRTIILFPRRCPTVHSREVPSNNILTVQFVFQTDTFQVIDSLANSKLHAGARCRPSAWGRRHREAVKMDWSRAHSVCASWQERVWWMKFLITQKQ